MATPFAAVLLAGGKSRRMGRDKAFLPTPDGRRLWQRQWDLLQGLKPDELFISGVWREGFPDDLSWIADTIPDAGPLAGIAATLRTMRSPRLMVFAVDLPVMTTKFLHDLAWTENDVGVVPRHAGGFYEPLAAVYPQAALEVAEGCLQQQTFKLQSFVDTLVTRDLMVAHPITEEESGLFTNWNSPDDLRL